MYSHADRIRAVELYIKLGKRVKATIRQLGYPTKNALRNWYREYQQHQDLRVRCVARAPKFTEAQKQTALEHYRTHDRCISATMRALGYPGRNFDRMGSRGISGGENFDGWSILASGLSRRFETSRGS